MPPFNSRLPTTPIPFRPAMKANPYLSCSNPLTQWKSCTHKRLLFSDESHKKLAEEIKRTNHNLRIRRYKQNFKHEKNLLKEDNFELNSSTNEVSNIGSSCDSRSFSQFLRKKKIENSYMTNKMRIFGNTLTERSKAKVECEINDLIKRNTRGSNKSSDTKWKGRLNKYLVCHKILENLFDLMVQNPQRISLKTQNPEIYMNLKKQMIQAIIDEETILQLNKQIEQELKDMRRQNFNFSKSKFMELSRNSIPFYLLKENKKDQLTEQIEKQLETFKLMVLSALQEFKSKHSNPGINYQWVLKTETQQLEDQTRIQ